jgi:hypothetical protein
MTKVRSEYIKKLMAESHSLEDKLKDVAQTTINNILEEKTNKNLRQILSEDENSFSEEEVDDNEALDKSNASEEEGADTDDSTENDEEWDDLEQYKDEDGEYDLRSMDKDELVKVLKVMSPDDAVRIVKNDDDSLTVTDETNDEEYELELDDDDTDIDEFDTDDATDDDNELEIEVDDDDSDDLGDEEFADDDDLDDDEIEIELDEANLGYTDDYQKKTAMTTPDNHEPASSKSTYSMDGGVPTGPEKPWVGPKKKSPYDDEVNEGCDAEGCANEESLQEGGGEFGKVAARVSGKQHRNNSNGQGGQPYGGRHNSVAGEYKDYEPSVSESIKKKANQVFTENKQLKSLMGKLQNQVNEALVVNQSLGNIVKIINENTTTANEKKEILRRFNECTTREESNKLYATISEELKRNGKTLTNVADTFNGQLSEARNRAVETPMYQSQDLSDTLSFMQRLDKIK